MFRYRSMRPVEQHELLRMSAMLAHRGPDGSGVHTDGCFGFAHRRLSIIDLAARAAQPMASSDGTLHISFNGEIYNYLELRDELQTRGEVFRTTSDTEVLLALYRTMGPACLRKLNGMFAFAVWDSRDRSLFLARDHVGIKPLYVSFHREGLTFGSEIKALFADESVPREPASSTLDAYLRFGYVPGEETMFAGISRLLPGHYMHVSADHITTRRYWDVEYGEPSTAAEAELVDEAESLMRDAVRLQLRSDVPLGVFLSGGLDSSMAVALTSALGARDLNTYSVGWKQGRAYDESEYAREVSRHFSTVHHEHWMDGDEFRRTFDTFTWLMDEPVTEAAAISLYRIACVAREKVTVVLSGEGADEVFGGYPIYLYMQLVEHYKRLPKGMRGRFLNPLLGLLGSTARKYIRLSEQPLTDAYMGVSFYDRELAWSLLTEGARRDVVKYPVSRVVQPIYAATAGMAAQRRMQYLDLKSWLVDDLLIKADRMTMGASLELRVPFLDYRLLEFSAKLPPRLRIKNRQPKYLMKKAAETHLPRRIIYRKKRGFPTPLSALLRNEMHEYVADMVRSRVFRERGVFAADAVERLLRQHVSREADNHKALWQVLVLENWYRTFTDPAVLAPPGGESKDEPGERKEGAVGEGPVRLRNFS